MCYFAFIGVDAAGPDPIPRLRSHGLSVRKTSNPSVIGAFPDGVTPLEVTLRSCSCDLYPPSQPLHLLDAVRELLQKTESVILFVHWFEGAIDEEAVPAVRHETCTLAALEAAAGDFPEDTVFTVTR